MRRTAASGVDGDEEQRVGALVPLISVTNRRHRSRDDVGTWMIYRPGDFTRHAKLTFDSCTPGRTPNLRYLQVFRFRHIGKRGMEHIELRSATSAEKRIRSNHKRNTINSDGILERSCETFCLLHVWKGLAYTVDNDLISVARVERAIIKHVLGEYLKREQIHFDAVDTQLPWIATPYDVQASHGRTILD